MISPSRRIVICTSGLTASGKSTAAKRIAEKYRLKYISGGVALMELALRMGYKPIDKGWWEASEGMRFLEQRSQDSQFDKKIDAQLLQWAKKGNVVLDSWTMPWLSKTGFKIWLDVSSEERARRLSHRDGISVKKARHIIREKDGRTKQIYRNLYGFELGEDYSPFDLVLDGDLLTSNEVFSTLSLVIERLVLKKATMKL